MPGLDDRRPATGPDDIDREEVVVHDEDAGRGEIPAGDDGPPRGDDPATKAAARPVGQRDDDDLRVTGREVVADGREVAAEARRVRGGEHDPRAERQPGPGAKTEPHEQDAEAEDEVAHRGRMSWSITRSVEPASRWEKWLAAKAATLSTS